MVFVQAMMEHAYYLTEKPSVSLKRNVGLALDGDDPLLQSAEENNVYKYMDEERNPHRPYSLSHCILLSSS